jgi:DivIVA domain-containing protein
VPQDGPLSGADLRRVRFPLAVRGYRMSDVDALLDRLATQLEAPADDTPYRREGDTPRGDDHSA